MKVSRAFPRALALALLLAACRRDDGSDARETARKRAERAAELEARLAGDSATSPDVPVARWTLSRDLAEISGLALTADGRLLAHDDENGRVAVLDVRGGAVLKRFALGATPLHGDFEGITVAGSSIYMVMSDGTVLEFPEGDDGARVRYSEIDTKLGKECEFEGIAYDSTLGSLLLACKRVGLKHLRGNLVIYRWRLGAVDGERLSMLTVPLARVVGDNGWKRFPASDITVEPASGNYVMIASQVNALVEITPGGEVVRSVPLPGEHGQPEGVAITRDSLLIVSDEATSRTAAVITVYRWPPGGPARPARETP
jgi:uncharacterized protein YjiK